MEIIILTMLAMPIVGLAIVGPLALLERIMFGKED